MTTMKAVVYDRPGEFEVRQVPVPEAGPGQVLLRVVAAGVCGTDLHLHEGEFGPVYPLTPGHEVVGEVVAAGPGVTEVEVGGVVALDNMDSCGRCVECRRARPASCLNLVAEGVSSPGGFAEFVLTSANRCFGVDDLSPEVAVFAEPTACVVHGLDMLALPPSARVLVFGAGPTGLLLTQLLARSGAVDLTVAAPTQTKLDLALAGGADRVVRLDRAQPAAALDELRSITPDGFDLVVDATGAPAVLQQAVPLTRAGGTVLVYGMTAESATWSVSPYDIFRRELTIKGSYSQQFSFDRSLANLRSGRVDPTGMVTHRFSLDDYAGALAAVADSSCVKALVTPAMG